MNETDVMDDILLHNLCTARVFLLSVCLCCMYTKNTLFVSFACKDVYTHLLLNINVFTVLTAGQ